MRDMRAFAALCSALLVCGGAHAAASKTLWSIYGISEELPCDQSWTAPIKIIGWNCHFDSVAVSLDVSICSRPKDRWQSPYDVGKPITIVGFEITHILSSATAQGRMVVGSWHGWRSDGADIFAMTGGVGTTSTAMMFPPGVGIPQGEIRELPGKSHIDVYAICTEGRHQTLVNIFYTSP